MDAGTTPHSDQSSPVVKPLRPKSRKVTSRFLSSPADQSSPLGQKPRSIHSNESGGGGSMRRLWPSTSSSNKKKPQQQQLSTLADHLGNERFNDLIVEDKVCSELNDSASGLICTSLSRQRSCTQFSRFEKFDDHLHESRRSAKENHRPLFGGSMRYTGKLRFPGAGRKSASSSSSLSSGASDSYLSPASADDIVPGRFSVDENALRRRSFGKGSEDLESECSDVCSGNSFGSPDIGKLSAASYMAPTVSSRKSGGGIQVSSRYMQDSSPKKFTVKNAISRSNSITTSKWALSPGRSASPPMTAENKGTKPVSFLSMKPPTSPSRPKGGGGGGGVGNFLSKGLHLFRSKKSSPTSCSSPLGPAGMVESVHQLRVLHSGWVQWRYANARADHVNARTTDQAERNLIYAWNCVTKLEQSVIQKKLQLEKEKLQMKLNFILLSQVRLLEAWGDMERQHLSAISMTKDCLHSVICRVPLAEDAKMDLLSSSITLRNAADLSTSIKSMLYMFSPTVEKTASVFSELAKVVTEEKALLEELFELFSIISTLEIEERSLRCSVTQLKLWQKTSAGTAT